MSFRYVLSTRLHYRKHNALLNANSFRQHVGMVVWFLFLFHHIVQWSVNFKNHAMTQRRKVLIICDIQIHNGFV